MATENGPLEAHLSRLLSARTHPKTICPSEACRALSSAELHAEGATHWRDLMPRVRDTLFSMRDRGEVEILQGGQVLGSETAAADIRGPIRARKPIE